MLTLPGPATDFQETGDKLRTMIFELMAPSSNRLLNSYPPTQTLADIAAGKAPAGFDLYALVETLRQGEYLDCQTKDFDEAANGMESTMGKIMTDKVADVEEEFNFRLKSLGAKPISVGQPEMLGEVFRKTDAAGFAMLLAMQQGDRSVKMAGGFALIRVRNRMIFAYLYRKYESPETVTWLSKSLETWSDAILAKNR